MSESNLYRKKPVVIEAVLWTGENRQEIKDFVPDALSEVLEFLRRPSTGMLGLRCAEMADALEAESPDREEPC